MLREAKAFLNELRTKGVVPTVKITFEYLKDSFKFQINTRINKYKNKIIYDAPANPTSVITVDTDNISLFVGGISDKKGLGQIKSGDWDTNTDLIDDVPGVKGLRQRFVENKRWEETLYYQNAKEELINKEAVRGCRTIEDFVEERCDFVDRLYTDIQTNGYIPETSEKSKMNMKYEYHYRSNLEILVAISRSGDILLYDGRTRFTIADILDLTIPVQVVCRHTEWQKIRDRIHNGAEVPEDLRNHPDLADIINE